MSGGYERAFAKVLFPLYESVLRRRRTLAYLREAEANQWLDATQIAQLQWRKLSALIEHCWREVPFYQQRWRALGLTPHDIRSTADYARLPVITKADVREHYDDLHAVSFRGRLSYKSTGGSTGEPMRFGYTRESYERRIAAMWRGYAWAGARMGRRTLYLWGASIGAPLRSQQIKDRLYHAAFNRRMLNAFLMSEARMQEYAAEIDSFRPEIIVSYVAPIVQMAQWLLKTGTRPHRPQAILSAAESLHPSQRETIERAFGCPVYNTYGCREVMLIAAECERREGLHLTADHLLVELDSPRTSPGGETVGEVVLTDLHNFGMPLLRYANGDLATAASELCACGRGLPLLRRIDGRKLDTLHTPDGHLLPGEYIVYVFLTVPSIRRYQVIQRQLDTFDVYLVPDAGFGEHVLQHIRDGIAKAVGSGITLRFHVVDDIAASSSGKFRVTICELG
ncbi:MAG: phenylacetate--CoA ligase family protein [Dokdonella sp.]